MRQHVTRQRFLAISRVIKDQRSKGIYNAERIARTKTFPAFERYKAEQQEKRRGKSAATVDRVDLNGDAHKIPLHKPSREQKSIAEELEELAKSPVTHEELSDALRPIYRRVEALETAVFNTRRGIFSRATRRTAQSSADTRTQEHQGLDRR